MNTTREGYINNNGTLELVRTITLKDGTVIQKFWSARLGWVTIPAREENES